MSGYASREEVLFVTLATLKQEGRNPAHYYVSRIIRDAFYPRGAGYGWGWHPPEVWHAAVAKHRRRSAPKER